MSLQTTKGFNYPQYTDTPDVPRDIYNLATEIDSYLTTNRGPQGLQGVQGIQGVQGTQGLQGIQGYGYQQLQGIQGIRGDGRGVSAVLAHPGHHKGPDPGGPLFRVSQKERRGDAGIHEPGQRASEDDFHSRLAQTQSESPLRGH